MMRSVTGPRTGDWVRALGVERDAGVIEGALHLRYVPSLDYVQVNVNRDGRLYGVHASSIEVLRPGAVPVADLEANDPVRHDPGWRSVTDLDQARAEGLIREPNVRTGTWTDMFAVLDRAVAPLLDAGWRIVDTYQDPDSKYGDVVAYDLERGDDLIEVDCGENGWIGGWELHPSDDPDNPSGATEPSFVADGTDDEQCRAAFEQEGWLEPPPSGQGDLNPL
jgi:hypothetical protein